MNKSHDDPDAEETREDLGSGVRGTSLRSSRLWALDALLKRSWK